MNIFGSDRIPKPLLGAVAVIALGVALSAWWLLADRSAMLFEKLEPASLEAVSTELARAGIAYELDREAGAIAVAPADEQRARLAIMSSQNAFRESVGFELFNGSDFGMTEFAQKVNYQRAIEGELARTISALDEIKYARVHLVLPEHGLFRQQQREPRAAITVFLENGVVLTPGQISGVQRIAAAAVPELSESAVTITDESGRILSATATDAAGAHLGSALAQKQALEGYLGEKARSVLAKALGAEHFAVSVDVTLDFARRTTRTQRVLDGASIQRIKESSRSERSDAQGSDHLKEVEYSLGHEIEQIEHGAGSIRQIQVGVMVDRDIANVDVEKLRELVAAAVGIEPQRGDKVAVVRHGVAVQRILAGADSALPEARPVASRKASAAVAQLLGGLAPWLWVAVALVLILSSGALLTRRAVAKMREARVHQLRHRLQSWIEAEQVEVGP